MRVDELRRPVRRGLWRSLKRLDAALPIGVKLLVPLFVIAAVSNIFLARTVYAYEAGRIREEFAARAHGISHEIHTHAATPNTASQIKTHDFAEMQIQLDSLVVAHPSLLRVELVEVDGESATIRASSDHSRIALAEESPEELAAELRAMRSSANVSHEDHVGETPTLLAAMPFELPGDASYVVATHVSTAERERALAALLWRFELGVAPGLLLTAVVLAGGVHILINRRLRYVLAAADGLQSGDLAARVNHAPRDPHDEMLRLAVRFNSMAEAIEKLHLEVEAKAVTDELTGLYNRRFIMETLAREVGRAHRHGEPLSVLMADVDGLKEINDGLGHQAGDEAIRYAATALRVALRDVDYAGRIGGDELAAVLPNCDEDGLATVMYRLQQACRVQVVGDGVACTLSSGGAVFRIGDSAHTLLGRADGALYEVKRSGKDSSRIAA